MSVILHISGTIHCDFHLWYTFVKWYYLQVFFWFFQNLYFLGVRWVKGQKLVKIAKKFCPSHSISQEPYIIWSSFVVHNCKMIISPSVFFICFEMLIFGLLGGSTGKKKKWSKMGESFVCHPPYLRNHTSWFSFMLHMCEMILSRGVFFHFFQILIFWCR